MLKLILISRYLLLMLLTLCVQQVIVASTTVWFARLAKAVHDNEDYSVPLGLAITSLVIQYLPAATTLIFLKMWEQETHERLVERAINSLFGKINIWSDRGECEKRVTLLTKEGLQTLSAFTLYVYDFAASCLNALFNIVALSLLFDGYLAIAYFLSLLLAAIVIKVQAEYNSSLTEKTELSRIDFSSSLLNIWDNVVLANRLNFDLWKRDERVRFSKARRLSIKLTVFNQAVSISIAFAAMLPCFIAFLLTMHRHAADPAYLIAMVVALPRLFQILNSSHAVLANISEWSSQRGRLNILQELFSFANTGDSLSRIKFGQIKAVTEEGEKVIESAADLHCLLNGSGRYTITGPNGSGKTTLLLSLKERLGESSFYLPAQHRLFFESREQGSTGETLKRELDEILRQPLFEVLLLDEWDANLDEQNRSEISSLIDRVAEKISVFEVRHRALKPQRHKEKKEQKEQKESLCLCGLTPGE